MLKKTLFLTMLPLLLVFAQTNLSNKYRLAQTYEQSGRIVEAKNLYEELAKADINNNMYLNSLNESYLKLKEYENSITFLTNRIKQKPNDISLYGMLGSTYFLKDDEQNAVLWWEKGIALNNSSQINYTIITNYAVQNRAFNVAIKFLEEGKSKATDKIQFTYQLAQIYSYTMEYEKAAEEYIYSLLLQPTQLEFIERRMETYLSAVGAVEQSIKIAKKYKDENISVKELLAFLYIKNNQFEDSFQLITEIDNKKGGDGAVIYNFANTTFQNAQFDVSSKAFKHLIDKYPNSRFVPNSKIGFAKTLEFKLDEEWNKLQPNWKPIFKTNTSDSSKYVPIINTYKSLITTSNGDIVNEALFRVGNIYFTKFNNLETAKTYFEKIVKNAALSIYFGKANLELAKIAIRLNKLEESKQYLHNVFAYSQIENSVKNEAKFLMAKIEFYNGNFEGSLSTIANINEDLSNDLSNNAIELSMIINIAKSDSLNLLEFAKSDLKSEQLNFTEAEEKYKQLSQNENLFALNNISRMKYAEMLIAQDKFSIAIEILKQLSESKELNIFADRSFYLLAQVYEFGIVDFKSAILTYEKFLELFPNSLYLEKSKKNLKELNNNKSDNYEK
jgi:tetratricopeptide (TPR) repeat protein